MDILVLLAPPGLTVVAILALPFAFRWVYHRARAKGYMPPAAALMSAAGAILGIAIATSWEVYAFSRGQQAEVDVLEVPAIAVGVAIFVTYTLLRTLPQRNPRVPGPRQVQVTWSRLSMIAAAVCISPLVISAAFCVAGTLEAAWVAIVFSVSIPVSLGFCYYGLIYFPRYEARMARAVSLDACLAEDARSPVLYLRPFKKDSYTFEGDDDGKGTFENYFGAALSGLGPFVALGNPEDYFPRLSGAVRVYASDEEWFKKVDALARSSVAIIAEMSRSPNLRLEYEHLRREGMQEKVFVFTPHPKWQYRRWLVRWAETARFGEMQMHWHEFSENLAKLGYHLSCGNPGPGSVITFDAVGRGIVLTTQAETAADFVKPVEAWVTRREKIGRCVSTHCVSCGLVFHVWPADSDVVRERWCRNCEAGLTRFERAAKRFAKTHGTLTSWCWALLGMGVLVLLIGSVSQSNYVRAMLILPLLVLEVFLIIFVVGFYHVRVAKRVREQYLALAQAGDAVAMVNLGIMNREGGLLPRDATAAAEWFRRGAEAGDVGGMVNLAGMLATGTGGLQKDSDEAACWYRRAADLGSRVAHIRLENKQSHQQISTDSG